MTALQRYNCPELSLAKADPCSPFRTTYALSPATQKHLVDTYATGPLDSASSSSESPDSLYSDHSPTFPDQAFEYDSYAGEVVEHDEADYEGLMAAHGVEGWESPDASPVWGQWPETGLGRDRWSSSPKTAGTPRKGSIVSLSPRGSFSSAGPGIYGSLSSRRGSAALQRLGSEPRRDSDPSLLGFELAQRRRSSLPRASPNRRTSSVASGMSATGSIADPAEDARLRHMASMGTLDRRFSEVVEVTCPSDDDELSEGDSQLSGVSGDDVGVARARISAWSPSTCSTYDDDVSEVHTAPYAPTPELLTREPLVLSNFPLASVAVEQTMNTPELAHSDHSGSSPHLAPPTVRPSSGSSGAIATPPPPQEPFAVLRARGRPGLSRISTDYQFPPRSSGVPAGAAIPPPLLRSVSAPFFANTARSRAAAANLAKRAAGSFPVARSKPLGYSRLRESTRRGSVASDLGVESRRGSTSRSASIAIPERRSSVGDRRGSTASDRRRPSVASAERRRSSLADPALGRGSVSGAVVAQRRMSLVNEGPRRKSSVPSVHSHHSQGRKSSQTDANGRRTSGSITSRKSSVVSIGEYGYLAPSIVIDAPGSPLPQGSRTPSAATATPIAGGIQRRNAPALIQMPEYHFPSTAPNTPVGTMPRYNVLESFLGVNGDKSPSPGTPGTVTSADIEKTPKNKHQPSIMDRGRPVASPEFRDSFPFRHTHAAVVRVPSQTQDRSGSASPGQAVRRKAVPPLSPEQLRSAHDEHVRAQGERQAQAQATSTPRQTHAPQAFSPQEEAILRASASVSTHRRQISDDVVRRLPQRPVAARRQATLPVETQQGHSPLRMVDPERAAAWAASSPSPTRARPQLQARPSRPELRKQPSVTFVDRRAVLAASASGVGAGTGAAGGGSGSSPSSQQRPAAPSRTSSFSRFFHGHGKSKSVSQPQTQQQQQHAASPLQHKGSRSILRPISMDSHAWVSGGAVEMGTGVGDGAGDGSSSHGHGHGALWRMIAGNSPKSPKSPRSPRGEEDVKLPSSMRSFVQ